MRIRQKNRVNHLWGALVVAAHLGPKTGQDDRGPWQEDRAQAIHRS